MSELVSKDFLSKENTTYLYKTIITSNELDNISKPEKEQILKDLIDSMKTKYKTLDMSKINKGNMNIVKKQFNDLCMKNVKITKSKPVNTNHDRKFERDFNTIKKTVTISDRPNDSYGAAPKNSRDMLNTSSIADRLKELEDSRRTESKGIVVTPDFLKPVKVGKSDYEQNNTNTSPPPRSLLGYNNEEESNFTSSTSSPDKYTSTMSIQERLAQIEKERQIPSSTPNTNFNLHKNILSMQGICRQYNIRDYYIVGWDQLVIDLLIDAKLPGVDTTKIYHKSCTKLFGYKNLRDFAKRPPNQHVRMCGHPNELGHELIAQTLYNWITKQNNVQSKI